MKIKFIVLIAILFNSFFSLATIRYVKPIATGLADGSSWADASADVQAMINVSIINDEVWISSGIYKPSKDPFGNASPSDTRDKTFFVKDGVKIYGGFAGTETNLSERSINTNITTLSGDIGIIGDTTDNSCHVVLASANSIGSIGISIDGFTIIAGNANDSLFGSIMVNGNTIDRNFSGGIYIVNGTNMISNNLVTSNKGYSNGGGIYINNGINIINKNIFKSNNAVFAGGGILSENSINTFSNNTISGNFSNFNGGGIETYNCTNTFTNNTISGNSSLLGGGFFSYNDSSILNNNIFWGNDNGSNTTTANADIYYYSTSKDTWTNNLLQLPATDYNSSNSNYLGTNTGTIYATNPLFVNASNIAGADGIFRTADDGLALQATSPAINSGITSGAPATDIIGTTRPQGTGIDMGAYEWFSPCPIGNKLHVDSSVVASGNGSSWANAFKTLEEALAFTHCCTNIDSVLVAQGTYKPIAYPYNGCLPITTLDARNVTFQVDGQLKLLGGYPSGGGIRNSSVNTTILSGDIGIAGDTTDNCYHVVLCITTNGTQFIDGFTIKDGYANGDFNNYFYINSILVEPTSGAGIYCSNTNGTISNCIISNNFAFVGGGMYNLWSNNTISNCTFSYNTALYVGGGIYNVNSDPIISYCIFTNDTSAWGGCIGYEVSNSIINNCVFTNNFGSDGGLFFYAYCHIINNNCIFANNTGIYGSIAIKSEYGRGTYNNCVFANNISNSYIGLFSDQGSGTLRRDTITNSIIWGNFSSNNNYLLGNSPSITYCIIDSGYTGTGNSTANPLFINPNNPIGADGIWFTADDGLQVLKGSPA
jgi:hypothetical protein